MFAVTDAKAAILADRIISLNVDLRALSSWNAWEQLDVLTVGTKIAPAMTCPACSSQMVGHIYNADRILYAKLNQAVTAGSTVTVKTVYILKEPWV